MPPVRPPRAAVPVYAVGDAIPAATTTTARQEARVGTSDRFRELIDGVLGREGGYANHPADKGGETMWGVTIARARAAGYRGNMRDMTRTEAVEIYCLYYWTQPGFDRIEDMDPQLAERLFDAGINCGTGRAGQWLQRTLNVMNGKGSLYADMIVDGQCGAITRAALGSFIQRRGQEGKAVLREAVKSFQAAHYLGLAESDASQEAFIYGWMRSRILGIG
ncbi:hypothetical protein IAI61_03625 [Roseomonas sp. 573]|uniref:Secretion activator protein n=2 Tax=Roseomonas haemaphysalidis TaxID=2768162 RepID=A0ABS3KNC8_9PROT|nr:hypothetical protein [Roseomonas haemaphysalidis]